MKAKIVTSVIVLILFIPLFSGCSSEEPVSFLRDECDAVLCSGHDASGNFYELVATQKETALNYEIKIGVIKNNTWLIPLGTDSEFLSDSGSFYICFLVGGYQDIGIHSLPKNTFYFVDSGGFFMEKATRSTSFLESEKKEYVFLSCSTKKYFCIDENEFKLTSKSLTDNGKILLYKTIKGSNYGDSPTYDWYILDINQSTFQPIATNLRIYPTSFLSEGLVFANDNVFYDLNINNIIDLSKYKLKSGEKPYFYQNICSFEAINSLGHSFTVTIDKTGKILGETQN